MERSGARGLTSGLPGANMRRGNPPLRTRGDMCVATPKGGQGANGSIPATTPPSDPAPAHQVTLQVTHGVGGGGGG